MGRVLKELQEIERIRERRNQLRSITPFPSLTDPVAVSNAYERKLHQELGKVYEKHYGTPEKPLIKKESK